MPRNGDLLRVAQPTSESQRPRLQVLEGQRVKREPLPLPDEMLGAARSRERWEFWTRTLLLALALVGLGCLVGWGLFLVSP